MIELIERHDEEKFLALFSEFILEVKEKMINFNHQDTIHQSLKMLLKVIPKPVKRPEIEMEQTVKKFIYDLSITDFNYELIPYSRISEIIFRGIDDEVASTIVPNLKNIGDKLFDDTCNLDEKVKITFFKILRHIDLAIIQKHQLYKENEIKLISLQNNYLELQELNTKLVEENKSLQQKNIDFEMKIHEVSKQAETSYGNLISQFITILGIFAAILMGAFGSIQIFTSIFDNAHKLSIGKILIISSLGASSVILILFFLLHSIGKLIGRKLDAEINNSSFLLKFPFLFISHGIFIFVALVGTAIELSNIKLQYSITGFWWIIPLVWIIFFLVVINKNGIRILWPKSKSKVNGISESQQKNNVSF